MSADVDGRNAKVKAENRKAESRRRRQAVSRTGSHADWSEVDGALLAKMVQAVARTGGALRLGFTRDGGAYAVGFYDGDDKHTEYISPNDDVNEFMRGVIEDYED